MTVCSDVGVAAGNIYYCEDYSWKYYVFKDRLEAGLLLASFIKQVIGDFEGYIIGLAAGGVPVAYAVSEALKLPLDVIVVKKITYPWTSEAGFGAVALDGTLKYDVEAARSIGYTAGDVEERARQVREYVVNRTIKLRGSTNYENIRGEKVILVDDGIATGYTIIAASTFLRNIGAASVTIATPTSSIDGALTAAREAERLLVLNMRTGPFYAVAEAYIEWHDVTEEEALEYIAKTRKHFKPQAM
ncbi:MAG: phosphoribosyltransferase family protein [Thermoprotei archaeon]|nr:phosphoribosyltransferase family protein [Thermoprotei archaeon]